MLSRAHPTARDAPSGRGPFDGAGLGRLVDAAQAGDERAWTALVRRLEPMLRAVARRSGLSGTEIDDVVQTTWLRLVENLGDLRTPDAVGGWLAVTLRREAFRSLQVHVREWLTADEFPGAPAEPERIDEQVLASERRRAVAQALDTLPARHRHLMAVMLAEPVL